MSHSRHERSQAVFDLAVKASPEEREAFVRRECADDPWVLGEVVELLTFYADDVAEHINGQRTDQDSLSVHSEWFGPYRLLRRLGEGGMGVVYEALETEVDRRVALKVMRTALPSEDERQRFQREVMALARLKHPNIACLYRAGTAAAGADGRQFFAMELVDGDDLLTYANRHSTGIAARLALFVQIADAVHYAHSEGVVHRDLKPANVLVDRMGRVKLLDFGVAKFISIGTDMGTLRTRTGAIVGTLDYMPLEQVQGDVRTIGVRSDVYALGVVLYELLSGRLPYPTVGSNAVAAERLLRERDPVPLGTFDERLKGDLQTIVAKAIERDLSQRYASAAELAEDVHRHLRNEPIHAKRQSTIYRIRRFSRRHRPLVLGTGATILALAAGLLATSLALREARAQERTAVEARKVSEAQRWEIFDAAGFWLQALDVNALQSLGEDRSDTFDAARAIDEALLRPGIASARQELASKPETLASLLHSAGEAYVAFRNIEAAEQAFRDEIEVRRSQSPFRPEDSAAGYASLGRILLQSDRSIEALPILRDALCVLEASNDREWGPDIARTMDLLAAALMKEGKLDEAEILLRRALDLQHERVDLDPFSYAIIQQNLGVCLGKMGRHAEAFGMLWGGFTRLRRYGSPREHVALAALRCARSLIALRRFAVGERLLLVVKATLDDPSTVPGLASLCNQADAEVQAARENLSPQ